MAKDTQLIVTVPGDFNEKLSKYMFILEDKGVSISKANVIIDLAIVGYWSVMKDLEKTIHYDDDDKNGTFGISGS